MDESVSAGQPPHDTQQTVEMENNGAPDPVETRTTKPISQTSGSASGALTVEHLVDKALHFLSHASNETLGACLVGLGATTYFVLGRVGLVIMGVAGGVVLHATWDGSRSDRRDEEAKKIDRERRREAGVELARRVWEWRFGGRANDSTENNKVYATQDLDFSSMGPETEKALNTFTNAVMQDYVYYWYGPTLPSEESFPRACRRTLTAYILSLAGHLQHKRSADAFLDFVTNASSIVIVFLNELAAATNASPHSSAEDAIDTYLKMKPESSLSYMLNENSQSRKLGDISEDILQAYLDTKAYNCAPVHVFLKEVLAQLVLGSTITLCSRPEWINEWIVYGLEESETASKVMDIVDAGVEGRQTVPASPASNERSSVNQKPMDKIDPPLSKFESPVKEHRRQISKAEEAMDEAMREAKRLTQLMIEEDERRAREEMEKQNVVSSSEDVSDLNSTHGAPTPTSSQSDRERQDTPGEGHTPGNPGPEAESSIETPTTPAKQFTSFDQILPPGQPTALAVPSERHHAQLTLHLANISIFDDSQPGEKTSIKAKPATDYLIQIEPSNSVFPGWMISRKYADFETLHEILRRISVITGVTGFTEAHANLPRWKGNTKSNLRVDLERYLIDAVKFQPLAESEGMKRFLEKDQGLNKSPTGKGFGWPTPDAFGKLGGDMINVLTKAPKQVAGGGKAVLGGVAGLVVNNRKMAQGNGSPDMSVSNSSMGDLEETVNTDQLNTNDEAEISTPARQSVESLASGRDVRPRFSRQMSSETGRSIDIGSNSSTDNRNAQPSLTEDTSATISEVVPSPTESAPTPLQEEIMHLPPPPSEMPEDYGSTNASAKVGVKRSSNLGDNEVAPPVPPRPSKPEIKPKSPLSERETSVAVELIFAVISELYTLSSAWNFRRTLLTAAKTFLLRPGNPQLIAIRDLLQNSLIDANLSDDGLAFHILKLRENALPTEEELEAWKRDYPEKTPEEKEELRLKARRLLVTKGMPQALTSVMGAAASGEALGKVFDCLQVEKISRGLVFGLMLQMLRIVTH